MSFEKFDWKNLSPAPVIGVDEVGRGCLAGPVYAAACVLNEGYPWQHYTDSKKLSPKKRKEYSEQILSDHHVCVAWASVEEIDELNILNAALLAMKRAVEGLKLEGGHVLVDGTFQVPGLSEVYSQTTLVKGDLRAEPVAAASIAAKVARDEWISSLDDQFPDFGFSSHKGYSTKVHKEAIARLGPTQHHRRTFAGVREYL